MLLGRLPGLLGRLRVRQKLVLLVLPLLALMVIGAVPLVADRIGAAEKSSRTAHVVQRAVRIGDLVQELQQERLASVGYLSGGVGRDRLVARSARAVDQAAQLATDYRDEDDDRLASALRTVTQSSGLGGLRGRVLRGGVTGLTVYMGYTRAIDGLLDALRLSEDADLSTEVGRQELALDSIIRHDEGTAAAGAALFLDADLKLTDAVLALVSAESAIEDREERVFEPLADPDTVELYELVEDGPSRQGVSRYLDQLEEAPGSIRGRTVPRELLAKIESVTVLGRLVETRAAAGAARGAAESATRDRWLAGLGLALALVVLAGAAVLSMLVARSISVPLRRLTESADEVAEVARDELVRVADTEDVGAAAPHLQPVQVGTADELGELAAAFNRVQQVAADLVERQVVSRRNVATMYGNVGRRTQNLVGRQLAMIDSLERNEQDPAMLDRLYRLDHVSTRLRRNANSLIVLSGTAEPELMSEPLSIAGAVRSALGEIEGFQRVRLTDFDPALLTPQVAPDVILLLAELLENGTSFSPPDTEVEVGATWIGSGDVLVRIVDHGLGMTPEQLDAENARLVERERLDLAPTDVLGLFVVGRLARRHGIQVTLRPTTRTGVTADVLIPARHLVTGSASGAWYGSSTGSDSGRVPVPVAAVAASTASAAGMASARGWWEPPVVNRAPAPRPPGAPAEAAEAPAPRPAGPRPSRPERPAGEVGPGGIVRRVRGAQLPDTGGPAPADPADTARDEPQVSPGSPDEARRAIEDFEEGVRRALRESAAVRAEGDELSRRNGHLRMSGWSGPLLPGPMPVPPLPPSATGPVDPTRSLLAEFEEGVRRALARIDAASRHRKQGGDGSSMWGTFFERHPSRPVPAAGPNGGGATAILPATTPAGPPEASPEFRAGASAADVAAPREQASTTDHPAGHPAGGEGAAGTAFRPPVEPASSSEGDSGVDAAAGAGGAGPAAPSAPPGSAPTGGPDGPGGSGPPRAAGARDGGPEPGMSSPAEAGIAGSDGSGVVPASRMPEQASNQESTPDSRQDEVHPLVRRVPGTQMPEGARAAPPPKPPQPSPDAGARDAEAARALVEEFEAGVQRALRTGDDGPGAEDEEGGAG